MPNIQFRYKRDPNQNIHKKPLLTPESYDFLSYAIFWTVPEVLAEAIAEHRFGTLQARIGGPY